MGSGAGTGCDGVTPKKPGSDQTLALTHPIMLGGYPVAAARERSGLFDARNKSATCLFSVGNAVLRLGLAAAAEKRIYPNHYAKIGAKKARRPVSAGCRLCLLWAGSTANISQLKKGVKAF